jgi:hypothetical protein
MYGLSVFCLQAKDEGDAAAAKEELKSACVCLEQGLHHCNHH